MYMTDFLQYLINKGEKIKPSFIYSGWLEFDTISDIQTYEKLLFENKIEKIFNILNDKKI